MPLPSLLVSTRLTTSPSEHLSWNICDGEQVARIEGRIRDIRWHQWNLTCTLKTIGVLNLRVSGGFAARLKALTRTGVSAKMRGRC